MWAPTNRFTARAPRNNPYRTRRFISGRRINFTHTRADPIALQGKRWRSAYRSIPSRCTATSDPAQGRLLAWCPEWDKLAPKSSSSKILFQERAEFLDGFCGPKPPVCHDGVFKGGMAGPSGGFGD